MTWLTPTPTERKGLSKQLTVIRDEKDALTSNLKILMDRRKNAYLAIYENALQTAKLEASELYASRKELAKALENARRAKLFFMKDTAPGLARPERETQMLAINTELSRIEAQVAAGQQTYQRLANSIHRAEMNLASARVEVSKWE